MEKRIPFGDDTLFNLYSATKLVTCTAVLQLWEQGRIQLDEPIATFLPEYADVLVRKADDPEATEPLARPITILHLLTMAGGVRGNRDTDAVRQVIADTNGRAPTRDIVRAFAAAPLQFQPGTHFEYNACHDVLGALVEVVSGMRFSAYLRAHILGPIGMKDTAFQLDDSKLGRMAKHYVRFDASTGTSEDIRQPFTLQHGTDYEAGGGGLISSVPDYILFAETLANGGLAPNGARILRPETIDAMRQNRLAGDATEDFAAFGGWSKAGYGYGLGVRTLIDPERNNSLSQRGEFGWDGALGCYVVVDPDAELALFYAQQEAGSRWYEWHGTIRNYAYASVWA